MTTMEGFQMFMNFLVMPLFFLSGAMFPMTNLPGWLNFLMKIDPLTYGVDALRHLIYSGADPRVLQFLVHYTPGFDLAVVTVLALLLGLLGSWSFSRQE
jgi:ABC-2 type transport system permease protein